MSSQRSRDLNGPTKTRTSNRKRYWPMQVDGSQSSPPAARQAAPAGEGARSMPRNQAVIVEKHFSHDAPLVRDHLILSERVLIGATYVSMAIEWAAKCFGDTRLTMTRLTFTNALRLSGGESAVVGLTVDEEDHFYAAAAEYRVSSQEHSHVAARFHIQKGFTDWAEEHIVPDLDFEHSQHQWSGDSFYHHPAQQCYGPSLRSVERVVQLREGVVLGRIRVSETMLDEFQSYLLHPSILDACHVVSSFSLPGDPVNNHRIPLMIKRVDVAATIDAAMLTPCYCRVRRIKSDAQLAEMDISLYDAAGKRILVMEGFTTKALSAQSAIFGPDDAREAESTRPSAPASRHSGGLGQHDLDSAVQQYLKNKVAAFLGGEIAEISAARNFMELGLESHSMIAVVSDIEADLGIELYPTLFFEYQNIASLASHFKEEHGPALAAFFERDAEAGGGQAQAISSTAIDVTRMNAPAPAPRSTATSARTASTEQPRAREDDAEAGIAIIGMSAYLPRSENLSEFWQHLVTGRDLVEEVPKDRWDYRLWFDEDPSAVNRTYSKWGSFIDDVDKFDPQFFGIAPRVADWMDPQVRLLLQCAQQTFEDAGVINGIRGSRTDVYVGSCYSEYWDEVVRQHIPFSDYQSHSLARSFLSATLSYTFDLQGASIPLDNACASSLTALHLGCQAIRQGECDQALVAGANLLLSPLHHVHFSRLRAMSPSGRCHTFDRKADGYVPGEGVVSVLIKPLAKAIADRDNIHAIIRGTAINHVGRANNPTSPRPELQVRMLLNAWEKAGIDPRQLSYLEAHGTGTKLGDPIEINALKTALKIYTSDRQFCAIGSTKAHIGHLEGAAGLVSLIKVILMMKHRKIPRMPNFEQLNDYIELNASPFYINNEVQEWGTDGRRPRLAGISAFGMTGNNAHVVVEEYRDESVDEHLHAGTTIAATEISGASGSVHAVPLSAQSDEQLRQYAEKLLTHLERHESRQGTLASLAYTLQMGRESFSHRVVFVVRHLDDLKESLRDFVNGRRGRDDSMYGSVSSEEMTAQEAGSATQGLQGGDQRQLAERWVRGLAVDWERLYGKARPRKISLPTYPFRKQRHWMARTPAMAAHPPPDIDPSLFNETSATKEEPLSVRESTVHAKYGPSTQATSDSPVGKHGNHLESADQHWIEQALPAKEDEWLQTITSRHGQRVLVVVRDERQFREVAKLFEGMDAILGRQIFDMTWVQVAQRDEPSLHAPLVRRFHSHDHDSLAPFIESLAERNRLPHLVLHFAHASPDGQGAVAQRQWFARLLECLAEKAPHCEIHAVAVFEDECVEPADGTGDRDGLALLPLQTPGCHHHKVLWVDEAVGLAERAALAVNEWLWDASGAALVNYRGDRRRILAPQRRAARPTETPDIEGGSYGFLRKHWYMKPAAQKAARRIGDCLVLVNEDSEHLLPAMPDVSEFGGKLIIAFGDARDLTKGVRLPFDRPQLMPAAVGTLLERHPAISAVVDLSDLFHRPRASDGDKIGRIIFFQQLVQRLDSLAILHITKGLQTHLCDAPSLAGARIAGLFRMLSAEYKHVRSKSIDLDDSMMSTRAAWRMIVEELRGDVEETEICYRHGVRYAARLQEESGSPPIADMQGQAGFLVDARGVYIVTGGTSGVGLEIARYLAARGARNLMLMGKTALPAREQWQELISRGDMSQQVRTKLVALSELERSGVRLFLYTGELADETSLQLHLSAARQECGSIRGVIHSAAAMQRMREASAAFVNKKIEDIQETLSPKVDGLHALARLLASDPLQFFVIFSSVAGRVPRLMRGLSDYAAANAYLEHFVAYQNKCGNRFYRAIVWTGWRDTGSHSRSATPGTSAANAAEHAVARYGLRFNDSVSGRWLFERAMTRPSEDGVLWPTLLEREVLQRNMQRLMFADEPSVVGENASLNGTISTSGMAETAVDRAFQRLIETLQRGERKAAEPLFAAIDIHRLSDAQVEQLSHYLLGGSQEAEGPAHHHGESATQRQGATETGAQRRELDLDSGGDVGSSAGAHKVTAPRAGRILDSGSDINIDAGAVSKRTPVLAEIKALLKKEFAAVLRIEDNALSERSSFQSYGLDSISGMQLAVVLERNLGIDISPAWLVEYPNIDALGQKIAGELESRPL